MQSYQLTKELTIIDLGLYIKKHNTLIIGDLHLGIEDVYRKSGSFLPKFNTKELLVRLEKILKKIKKKNITIVLNGDVKHEYGNILDEEWRDLKKLFDILQKYGEVIIVMGNHDLFLQPIARKHKIKTVRELLIDDIHISHGDRIPNTKEFKQAKTVIIGHEHPAINIQDNNRVEKYKCFLKGKHKSKTLIVMPSLTTTAEGTNILLSSRLSPFLKKSLNQFEIFVIDDKIYPFGTIKQFTKAQKQKLF